MLDFLQKVFLIQVLSFNMIKPWLHHEALSWSAEISVHVMSYGSIM
jgi:hypothetical protein